MMEHDNLPVRQVLPELVAALKANSGAVLAAAPGAGKTTLVPPALLEAFGGGIVLLEPRRVAVRAAARWIASLLGEPVGRQVGYIVRGENRSAPSNRLVVMTPGVLLRRLQSDPELNGVSIVIFDEFHERSLEADLDLAFALDVRENLRPELKILIMSATLEMAVRRYEIPEIFNSDQGSQFTSRAFTGDLKKLGVRISLDGKGRCLDNAKMERFWWALKYEDIKIKEYISLPQLRLGVQSYVNFYNTRRIHSALDYAPPISSISGLAKTGRRQYNVQGSIH